MKYKSLVIIGFALLFVSSALARTYYVDGTMGNDNWDGTHKKYIKDDKGPTRTIQAAIDRAGPGNKVVVADGVYMGPRNIELSWHPDMTLRSANGPENCIIDCQGAQEPFRFDFPEASPVIDGFTITKATRTAISFYGQSQAVIKNCIIRRNLSGPEGGAIYCTDDSAPTISNCVITNNKAEYEGGGIVCTGRSAPVIVNCTISNNQAQFSCGGIVARDESSPVISKCTISGNTADEIAAGVLCHHRSSPAISNCTITDNWARQFCAGVYAKEQSTPVVSNSTITDNWAYGHMGEGGTGGGIACEDDAHITVTDSTIARNSAAEGGGVYSRGRREIELSLERCTITENLAKQLGGGVYCSENSLLVDNCTITDNKSGSPFQPGDGGGIFCENSDRAMISDSIITGNNIIGRGAGVFYRGVLEAKLINCLVTGNKTGMGGGVLCEAAESAEITNSTISGNWAIQQGGGVMLPSKHAYIVNSIIWGNYPVEIEHPMPDLVINFSNIQGGWLGNGIGNIDADPNFVQPGQWGPDGIPDDPMTDFWTEGDYQLQFVSPCIDAGTDAGVHTDIEGNVRPFDFVGVDNNGELPEFDMGAYEVTAEPQEDDD